MKSGSLNISGMPYRRSGHVGGKSVSMISMLALLMAALLVLPSCFDDDTETVTVTKEVEVTKYFCPDGTEAESAADCEDDTTEDPAMCDGTSFPGETLMGGDPNDVLCGLETNDTIMGGGGDDTITGGAGDDTIHGGEGADEIKGEAGDDKLYGDAGGDKIYGGDDDDEITGGGGSNMLDGGDGVDIAIYKDSDRVSVNLKTGVAVHIPADVTFVNRGGEDSLANIENVKGSHGNDVINGDDGPNLLKGLDGMDTINGHGEDDTILPNRPAGAMGMANTSADDEPAGDPAETDGVDTVNGGAGTDTISYEGERGEVAVNLSQAGFVPATTGDSAVPAHYTATVNGGGDADRIIAENQGTVDEPKWFSTIENVVGGTVGDMLTGDSRNNILKGLAGDDNLIGGAGDDVLDGGAGNDDFNGGSGNDMIYADNDDDEGAINGGNTLNDTDTPDVDESMPPSEQDTVSFAMVPDTDTTTEGRQGVDKSLANMTEVENLTGSKGIDALTGNNEANIIMGLEGNDTISGGPGKDTLNGGPGEDTLYGGASGGADTDTDVFVVFSGEGPDTIADYVPDTGEGVNTVKGDEIHLKNFSSQTAVVSIASATNVQVSVAGTVVLNITATTGATAPEAIKKDLEKAGKIVFVSTN